MTLGLVVSKGNAVELHSLFSFMQLYERPGFLESKILYS